VPTCRPPPLHSHALPHTTTNTKNTNTVRYFAEQLASELGTAPTVSAVAHLVKQMNYSNKGALLGAMLVGGWDAQRGGQVYGIPIGGSLVRLPWATDGSGSTYIWGYLDAEYKPGLDRAEAERLVATALALAISIDGSSGGMARLVTVTADGAERRLIRGDEVQQFWDAVEPSKVGGAGGEGMVVV
jgi:20S proteasome subunit beta 1